MRVEILHIDECPNWQEAGRRMRAALDETGNQATGVEYVRIASQSEAGRVPFAGSPTVLVDGTDLFPSDGRTDDLACRVYSTADGLAGVPALGQLEDALIARGHADVTS